MSKKLNLCPICGSYIRMTWAEECGACGAALLPEEAGDAEKIAKSGPSTFAEIVEWLSHPTTVIALIIGVVIFGSLSVSVYATATLNHQNKVGDPVVNTPVRAQANAGLGLNRSAQIQTSAAVVNSSTTMPKATTTTISQVLKPR